MAYPSTFPQPSSPLLIFVNVMISPLFSIVNYFIKVFIVCFVNSSHIAVCKLHLRSSSSMSSPLDSGCLAMSLSRILCHASSSLLQLLSMVFNGSGLSNEYNESMMTLYVLVLSDSMVALLFICIIPPFRGKTM